MSSFIYGDSSATFVSLRGSGLLANFDKMRKDNNIKQKTAKNFAYPTRIKIVHNIMDCCDFLKKIPDESIQLICIDPPYNLELAGWDVYDDYIEWASKWINEAYRVLSKSGNLVIFGGIQFRDTPVSKIYAA